MKTVEITYRHAASGVSTPPRPVDANSNRSRLDEGDQAFSSLLERLAMTAAPHNVSFKWILAISASSRVKKVRPVTGHCTAAGHAYVERRPYRALPARTLTFSRPSIVRLETPVGRR
jgi:hypothetical protein